MSAGEELMYYLVGSDEECFQFVKSRIPQEHGIYSLLPAFTGSEGVILVGITSSCTIPPQLQHPLFDSITGTFWELFT